MGGLVLSSFINAIGASGIGLLVCAGATRVVLASPVTDQLPGTAGDILLLNLARNRGLRLYHSDVVNSSSSSSYTTSRVGLRRRHATESCACLSSYRR